MSFKLRKWAGAGALLAVALTLWSPEWLCRAEIGAIRAYQGNLSDWMGRWVQCRYRPTCSHYAVESLESRGFLRGNLRIAKRLALCSPLGWALSLGNAPSAGGEAEAQPSAPPGVRQRLSPGTSSPNSSRALPTE